MLVGDDQFKPDVGRQIAEKYVKVDKVNFLTGIVFSNIMLASVPIAFENKLIYVSPNAAPSPMAGKDCNPYLFVASWPNDAYHEAAGQHATNRGYKNAYLIAPNYQAGKDSLTGFKRYYKGNVVAEVYTQLGQLDYAAELAQVRAAKPDALYIFLPGGMGINFIKQFVASGTVEGRAADRAGIRRRPGHHPPGRRSDAGPVRHRALGDRLRQRRQQEIRRRVRKGIPPPADRVRGAGLRHGAADRRRGARQQGQDRGRGSGAQGDAGGEVRIGARAVQVQPQPVPIQNYYLRVVAKDAQGRLVNKTIGTVFKDHGDAYVQDCKMK